MKLMNYNFQKLDVLGHCLVKKNLNALYYFFLSRMRVAERWLILTWTILCQRPGSLMDQGPWQQNDNLRSTPGAEVSLHLQAQMKQVRSRPLLR